MSNIALSIPKNKRVCGIEIKKMPLGAYLRALEKIKTFPADFMDICFPGLGLNDILDKLITLDKDSLQPLILAIFSNGPRYFISFVSELTGIDEKELLEDEAIGLDGFIEIINTFIEVNDLGKCFEQGKSLKKTIQQMFNMTGKTGSNF